MKCPNCGRQVRSKTQCAFCGYHFDEEDQIVEDVEELAEDDLEIIPRTRRSGSVLQFVFGIIKLVLVIFIVFLLIAFGPRYATQLWNQYGFGNRQSSSVVEVEETTLLEETTSELDTVEETTIAEPALAIASAQVSVTEYPLTEVVIDFSSDYPEITREDLELVLDMNGSQETITDYSLYRQGNQLTLRFNNPAIEMDSAQLDNQVLTVRSSILNIEESIDVPTPTVSIDQELLDKVKDLRDTYLLESSNVSVAVQKVGEALPYVHSSQSVDGSQLIAWFILARVFDAVDQNELSLEDTVEYVASLQATGDTGEIAQSEEEDTYTIETLLNAVIQSQDVTAMNLLIQATGGPNDFNLWLTEHYYFSTQVTALLSTDEVKHVSGAVVSVQDLTQLLVKIADESLLSASSNETLKEMLLNTPLSEKYPIGFETVTRRYEITTTDEETETQGYAAILLTEGEAYVVTIIENEVSDAAQSVENISEFIRQVIALFEDVELSEVEELEPVVETTQAVYQEAYQEEPTSTSRYQYGSDTNGDGFPDTVYDEAGGYYRAIRWVQGADGLYYFEYAE